VLDGSGSNDMGDQKHSTGRLTLTALVLLAELIHLAWQHFHGGVVSHHILNHADLPAISNGWGAVLLPAVTWFLTGRIGRRVALRANHTGVTARLPSGIVASFVAALAFGVVLSIAFSFDYASVSSTMFFGVLALAMFLPLYRAECVLGFILGMAFTFGAVLPTLIGSMIAAIAAFFTFGVRPSLGWVVTRFKGRVRTGGGGRVLPGARRPHRRRSTV